MDTLAYLEIMKYARRWNSASSYFIGGSIGLFAIEANWVPNNFFFSIPDHTYLYAVLLAIVCKLEAGIFQRDAALLLMQEKRNWQGD